MTNYKYAKFKEGKYLSRKEKKVIMIFIFYKKNLGEDPFALGMKIHWDKKKEY